MTNREFELEIEQDLRTRFAASFDNKAGRVVIINQLMRLCSLNHEQTAACLVRQFFAEELAELDPVKRDVTELRICVSRYFLKSLVYCKRDAADLSSPSRCPPPPPPPPPLAELIDEFELIGAEHNLKRMIFHSLHHLPDENAFRLMQRLGRHNLKWSYFYPLFVHEAHELDKKGLSRKLYSPPPPLISPQKN